MARFGILVLVLVLCHAGFSLGNILDSATHHAAPPAKNNWHGRVEKMAGLDAYVAGSASSSKAVIMISDVFGWEMPLFRKLADKVAAHGYYVVAPDFFYGDPLKDTADLPRWIRNHLPAGSVEVTKKLVKEIKANGVHSVGLAGFCWGSKVTALVAKDKTVNVIVQLHPSLVEASDYKEVKVPIAVLAAPTDGIEAMKPILKLKSKEVKVYVKIFTQVKHGWTIRYDENDKQAVKKANRAHMLMLKWFHKFL